MEGVAFALSHQVLDSEKEGHSFAARQLDRGSGVVDAVLLGELESAATLRDGAFDPSERVGLARHDLSFDGILFDVALAVG